MIFFFPKGGVVWYKPFPQPNLGMKTKTSSNSKRSRSPRKSKAADAKAWREKEKVTPKAVEARTGSVGVVEDRRRGDDGALIVGDGEAEAEREALQAFLGREESAEDFRWVDPAQFNHGVLLFIQQVMDVLHLRPCQVEALTGLPHQHLRKLRPFSDPQQDMHISLWTLIRFCNGLHIRLRSAVTWILKRLPLSLWLLEPLEA